MVWGRNYVFIYFQNYTLIAGIGIVNYHLCLYHTYTYADSDSDADSDSAIIPFSLVEASRGIGSPIILYRRCRNPSIFLSRNTTRHRKSHYLIPPMPQSSIFLSRNIPRHRKPRLSGNPMQKSVFFSIFASRISIS